MTVIGTDTFQIPRFLQEGEGIDLRQDGVSQALVIAREGAFTVGNDTIVLLSFGASNARGNEYSVSGSDKASDNRVTAFRPSTGTAPVATLGQEPFNTDTSIGTVNNIAFQIGKQLADRYNRNVLIILKAVANTEFTNYLTIANGGPSDSSNLFDSLAAGDDTAKLDSMVPTALALVGRTEVDFVHIDTGGVDTLEGQGVVFERVKTLTEQLRAQSWVAETTPIIYTEMPPRGSYDDVTNSLKRYCLSGIDPYVSLISTEGISFIVDEYPTVSDVAHYAGADHATMAARFITQLGELPHGNIGSTRNPLGGNGYILSTAASDGTVPGESRTVPYEAKCQIDGFVYTLSTPAATRAISYIQLLATDAPRNIRTTFHNYRSDGAVLCLMAPRKPALTIDNITVDGGNGRVQITYTGVIDDSDPDYRAHVYISGVQGFDELNGRYFDIIALDTVGKTFFIQNSAGVYTNGSSWTGPYVDNTGTIEEIISFEDPRTRNKSADEVYLFENESVTYERLGGGAIAPFRVTHFTGHPDYAPAQDLYRPDSPVLNGDFRMLTTGWTNATASETTWVIGAADSGRFQGSRSMTLTDTSGLANQLHWSYRLRVQEGDVIVGTCFAKASVAPSNFRLYLQYYDVDGVQVGSDVAGFADTSVRASYRAMSIADTVPADAVEAAIYVRAAMTSGTLTVTDFGLKRIDGVAYLEDFGAAGDGTTDDTMAFEVAIAAGLIVHGMPGAVYGISGELTFDVSNTGAVNVSVKQLAPNVATLKTISVTGADNVTLKNVKIDINGDGTNDGAISGANGDINTYFGANITGGTGHHIEDLEVFGNASCTGILFSGLDRTSRVIRPYVHDIFAVYAAASDDTVQGIQVTDCDGLVVEDAKVERLGWKALIGDAVSYLYTRGIPCNGNRGLVLNNPYVDYAWQGIDFTGDAYGGNWDCKSLNPVVKNCSTWGHKAANLQKRLQVVNGYAYNCVYAGFVDTASFEVVEFDGQTGAIAIGDTVTGATSGASGSVSELYDAGTTGYLVLTSWNSTHFTDGENIQVGGVTKAVVNMPATMVTNAITQKDANVYTNCLAHNCGDVSGTKGGFVTDTSTRNTYVPVVWKDCRAIDDRSTPLMQYGFFNAKPHTYKGWTEAVDCISFGHTANGFRGTQTRDSKEHIARLISGRSATNTTAVQAIFGSTSDEWYGETGAVYEVELMLYLANLASSGHFGVGFVVTSGAATGFWSSLAGKVASVAPSTMGTPEFLTTNDITTRQVVTNGAATAGYVKLSGEIHVTTGGVITPSFFMSVAAASTVLAGTKFTARKVMHSSGTLNDRQIIGAIG